MSQNPWRAQACAAGLAWIVALLFIPPLTAQDTAGGSPPAAAETWKLRRVLVPEQKLSEVIQGRYMPLRLDRFNELLELNRQQTDVSLRWPFDGLWLEGRIDSAGRLVGTGLVELNRPSDQQAWISQAIPGLQLTDLTWVDLEGRSARAGLGPKGQWIVENIGARQLGFRWSAAPINAAAPQRDNGTRPTNLLSNPNNSPLNFGNQRRYVIDFPGVVQTTLFLRLPNDWIAETSGAICRLVPTVSAEAGAGERIWRIDFSRSDNQMLTVRRDIDTRPTLASAKYVADTVMRLRPGVIESRTTIQWPERGVTDVRWTVPEHWTVTRIRAGTSDAPFELSDEGGVQICRVDLSGRNEEVDSLQINLERLFDFSESLTLAPPRPTGTWLRGKLSLELSNELQIDEWDLTDGQWLGPATQAGGLRRLLAQCFKETCRLNLKVSPATAQPTGVALSQVKAEGQKLTAVFEAWVEPGALAKMEWRFPLQEGWIVDQVAVLSNDAAATPIVIDSWDIIQDGATALVDVHLKQAFVEGETVRFRIDAHFLTFPSPLDPLPPEILGVVDLSHDPSFQHWLAVQAEPPYRFVWKGRGGQTLKPMPTDVRLLTWKSENPASRLLLLESEQGGGHFELQTELVYRFDADYEVLCDVGDRTISQTVKIYCRPTESRLNQIRLTWPEAPQGTWTWSLENPGGGRQQPLSAVEERSVGTEAASTLLQWGEGIDQPFVIIGQANQVWDQSWKPQVPRIDRAQRRTGVIVMSSSAREQVVCQNRGLARLPASAASLPVDRQLLGVFELADVLASESSLAGSLLIRREAAEPSNRETVVWAARIDSWPGATQARHQLTLDIQVQGSGGLLIVPTANSELKRVTLDGQSIDRSSVVAQPNSANAESWHIPLAPVPTRQRLVLDFTTAERLSSYWQTINVPLPQIESPVFQVDWMVHLPSGYRVAEQRPTPSSRRFDEWASWLIDRWIGLDVNEASVNSGGVVGSSTFAAGESGSRVGIEGEGLWVRRGVSPEAQLQLQRVETVTGLFWLVLFAFAALIIIVAGRHKYLPWSILAVTGLVVPWLPTEWQLWTAALIPGALMACAIQALRKPQAETSSEMPASNYGTVPSVSAAMGGVILMGGLMLLGSHDRLLGQEGVVSPPTDQRLIDVIMPVDGEGRPSQDLVFLPKEFHDQLLKTAPKKEESLPWIIESVRHVIDIESNPFSEQTRWRLTSRLRLRTLRSNVRFELPYSANQVLVLADQIQLDQNIARVAGTPDSGLQVSVETPGLHELVVPGVLLIPSGAVETFEWNPPRAPDTEFRINGLAASGWELEASAVADGSEELGVDRLRLIGPADPLRFKPRSSADPTLADTPELGLAEVIQTDGERLLVTLWFRPADAATLPNELKFMVGPGWEVQANALPTEADFRLSRLGDESVCELKLPTDESAIELAGIQLRSTEPLQAGRWELPVLRTENMRITSRQIVMDPPVSLRWEYERPSNPIANQIRDTLTSKWSTAQLDQMQLETQDLVVLEVPSAFLSEFLTIAPEPAILAVDQQVELALNWNGIYFDCSAIVSVMRGQVDSLELTGNLPFRLDTLSIEETPGASGVNVMRLAPDRYLVVFSSPQTSAFQLRLAGQVQRPSTAGPVPVIRFAGISDVTYRCHLQRDPLLETDLSRSLPNDGNAEAEEMSDVVDLARLDRQLRQTRETEVRLNGAQLTQQLPTWLLKTARVRQPLIDKTLVSFQRESTDWRVQMWVHVSPDEPWGVELLDIEVPEGFIPLNSGTTGRWVDGDTSEFRERRRWQAAERIEPGQWTRLEGTIPRFPDGPFLPRLAGNESSEYRIALPKAQQEDPFLWQYEAEIDEATVDIESGRLDDQTDWLVLRRDSNQNSARLASKPLVVRPTRVHLADYRILWQQDHATLLCRFLVDPGGKSQLPLHLPSEFVLKSVTIDGELRPQPEKGRGQIELVNRELPQEVVLWCETPLTSMAQTNWRQQVLPWLAMPAEINTVAVMRSGPETPPIKVTGLDAISAAQWQSYQTQATERVLEVAPTTTLLSQTALAHWIENWKGSDTEPGRLGGPVFLNEEELTSAAVSGAGEIVWSDPDVLESGGPSRAVRFGTPVPSQRWLYYRPRESQPPLTVDATHQSLADYQTLGMVTAVLALVFGLSGWVASRLSERGRWVLLLFVGLVCGGGLAAVAGPVWLGPLVIGILALGLLRLIFLPASPLASLALRR